MLLSSFSRAQERAGSFQMLAALDVRDIVLIDRLSLELAPGLTVLTGETGAGKSVLLSALGLALGGRAERSLLRQGADTGQVTAEFLLPTDHPVFQTLKTYSLRRPGAEAEEDGRLILRRVLTGDGRSRAFIDDEPVSLGVLRAVGDQMVETLGQHEERGLLDPKGHRRILDQFGGHGALLSAVASAYQVHSDAEKHLEELKEAAREGERERDQLEDALEQLDRLAPQEDEEQALVGERTSLAELQKMTDDLEAARTALNEGSGLENTLNRVLRRLERVAGRRSDLLEGVLQPLDRALVEIGETRKGLDAALRAGGGNQGRLEDIETRLYELRALARRLGFSVAELPGLQERLQQKLAAIDTMGQSLAAAEKALAEAKASYLKAARDLSGARSKAAGKLDKTVQKELEPLRLGKARFQTQVEADPDHPGPEGYDRVLFTIATAEGSAFGPLIGIASGGELSRFILALKVALSGIGQATTLVFDEVDRGVGGAVADAVGERLGQLAESQQILVVTHSPQVAAKADHHLLIEKRDVAGTGTADGKAGLPVETVVHPLSEPERREEIARMLAGATVTDEARAAARRLLETESAHGR